MLTSRFVSIRSCACGARFAHRDDACPQCGRQLCPARVRSVGRLLCETTVRVNPTGHPFRLGLVRLAKGVTALCIVSGLTRGSGYDRVRIVTKDGVFHAIGAAARVNGGSRRPPASGED